AARAEGNRRCRRQGHRGDAEGPGRQEARCHPEGPAREIPGDGVQGPGGVIRAILPAALLAFPAAAGTLEGRPVTFLVMAWDDPALPFLEAPGHTVVVGDGVEFDFAPEGVFS